MKTPSDRLYRLVKSLSGSEKRYFKIFINGKGGGKINKYNQLFDAIDEQEEFDDDALKLLIYEGQDIQSRKYSELKSYLYDLILKSLQLYDEKTSIDYRLKGMLLNVRVLFRRANFSDAELVLHKAKKLAKKYEDFNTLLEILRWEKEVAYASTNIGYLDQELERITKEEEVYIQQLNNYLFYRNTFLKLLVIIRKGSSFRKQEKDREFKEFLNHSLLGNVNSAISYTAKVQFYRIHSIYAYATLDWKSFHEYGQLLLEIMESQPYRLKEDVVEYISALSNFIASCSVLQQYEIMRTYLEKLKKVRTNTLDDELKIHRQYYLNKLELCSRTGEFMEGLETLKSHLKGKKKFDQVFFETSSFKYNYFYIYFGAGAYEEALQSLNDWLNMPTNSERAELKSLARILNLIIHYELGNYILLESLIRSAERYLQKQNKVYEYESLLIHFIKQIEQNPSQQELMKNTEILKNNLNQLIEIPTERAMLQYFDWTAWLESVSKKQTFAEAVRHKYQQSLS